MSDIDEFASRSHYHFRISLRVRHPGISPEKITEALGIEPKHSWKAGEPRRTPNGALLTGFNSITYWTANMVAGRWPTEINDAVHEALKRLVPYRSFLHNIRAEGGAVEFFVGWFFENDSGDLFTHQCLALAGDLQIDLSFDIYSPDQPQNEYDANEKTLR